MEKLRDIRGLERIDDISFYIFLVTVTVALFVLVLIVMKLYRFYRAKRDLDIRAKVLQRYKSVDFENPKKAAYEISKYGRYLADDERSQKIFKEMHERMQKYKYKKDVQKLSDEDMHYYEMFLGMVDE